MKVRMGDYVTEFWVSSESDGDKEYFVSLCEFPLGKDENGMMRFNGACGAPDGFRTHGCRDFIFRCEPQLKKPENAGKTYRCKHLRCSREVALDFMLPYLCAKDPNRGSDQLP